MTKQMKLRRWLFRTVKSLDPRWPASSVSFQAGMVLLAAVRLATTDPIRLSEAVGCSRDFVERIGKRARKHRLWRAGTVRVEWMKDMGDFAFVLDAMLATGQVVRSASAQRIDNAKSQRAQRLAQALCPNCGRPQDLEKRKICSHCRESMKRSHAKTRTHELHTLKKVDGVYWTLSRSAFDDGTDADKEYS